MRAISSTEWAGMRSTQAAAMPDTCVVYTYAAGSQNSYGEHASPTYTAGDPISCGLNMLTEREGGQEREREDKTILEVEAKLRLPLTTTITERDRVVVTHRAGEAEESPLTWEVVGPVKRGPTGIVLDLRRVSL